MLPVTQKALFFSSETSVNIAVPKDIVLIQQGFNVLAYQQPLFEELTIYCPDKIKNSVKKRQAEYLAGRYTAMLALQKLGCIDTTILTGKHRAPIWPDNINASISHTGDIALCIATLSNNYTYLGIDVEEKISDKVVKDIKKSIINEHEERLLQATTLNFMSLFSVVFSAKESLFKALYASVGDYFDFSAAEVFHICLQTKQLTLRLTENLSSDLTLGKEFTLHFTVTNNHVTTLLYA